MAEVNGSRLGVTVSELSDSVAIRTGENYSVKTIRRDLIAMEQIGHVSRLMPRNPSEPELWIVRRASCE